MQIDKEAVQLAQQALAQLTQGSFVPSMVGSGRKGKKFGGKLRSGYTKNKSRPRNKTRAKQSKLSRRINRNT